LILISFYLIIIIICYVDVFIAFNHFSVLPLMALNSLYCADVPLSNYSLKKWGCAPAAMLLLIW